MLLGVWPTTRSVLDFPRVILLKKAYSSRSYKLPRVPQLEVGLCAPPPSPCSDLSALVCVAFCMQSQHGEFIGAITLLCWEHTLSCSCPLLLALTVFLLFLPLWYLGLEWCSIDVMFRTEYAEFSYSVHVGQFWIFILIAVYWRKVWEIWEMHNLLVLEEVIRSYFNAVCISRVIQEVLH